MEMMAGAPEAILVQELSSGKEVLCSRTKIQKGSLHGVLVTSDMDSLSGDLVSM